MSIYYISNECDVSPLIISVYQVPVRKLKEDNDKLCHIFCLFFAVILKLEVAVVLYPSDRLFGTIINVVESTIAAFI